MKYHYAKIAFSKRNNILKKSGFDKYQDFLKSDIWLKIKERVAKKAQTNPYWRTCYICKQEKAIQLHHLKYKKIMLKVTLNSIFPLCDDCHGKTHKIASVEGVSFKVAMKKVLLYNYNINK